MYAEIRFMMPPRLRERPGINPLLQNRDRNIGEIVDEQFEAQGHG